MNSPTSTIVGPSRVEQAGIPLREYTDTYVKAFHEDAATLGLEEIEDRPRATD